MSKATVSENRPKTATEALQSKETDLEQQMNTFHNRSAELDTKQADFDQKVGLVETISKNIQTREEDLKRREDTSCQEIESKEQHLDERETDLDVKSKDISLRKDTLAENQSLFTAKEERFVLSGKNLSDKWTIYNKFEAKILVWRETLTAQEERLKGDRQLLVEERSHLDAMAQVAQYVQELTSRVDRTLEQVPHKASHKFVVANLKQVNDKCRTELKNAESHLETVRTERNGLKADLEVMAQQLQTTESDRKDIGTKLEISMSNMVDQDKQLKAQLTSSEQKVKLLTTDLDSFTTRNSAIETKIVATEQLRVDRSREEAQAYR